MKSRIVKQLKILKMQGFLHFRQTCYPVDVLQSSKNCQSFQNNYPQKVSTKKYQRKTQKHVLTRNEAFSQVFADRTRKLHVASIRVRFGVHPKLAKSTARSQKIMLKINDDVK